jgi:proteasome alpha subunit
MMGYDRAIVTFSPDGRLFQVEYARESVKRGTTSIGVVFSDGVVLVSTRPLMELAVPNVGGEKVFQIDDNLGITMAGFLADGRILIDKARVKAQVYKLTYDEPLDVLGVVKEVADTMQLYTQYGGVRPFGVAFLLGGIDEKGAQLFEIDPSSTFYSYKAHAIGRGAPEALKILRKEWKEGLSEDDGIELAIKSLKAGEKGLKMSEIEMVVVTNKEFKKFFGDEGLKAIKKYW